jgi:NADH:ubiquinone reductase (H+-translocating)
MGKKVMVLGAGYGGIFAAANLCKQKIFDIVIIDKNPYHQLLQQIPYIVSGEKDSANITIRLEELFRDEIAEGFLRVSHAIIKSVDLMRRTIKLQQVSDSGSEENLQYDYLIISLGAETHYFEVDGAEKHCMTFRSVQDAIKIRQIIDSLPTNSNVVVGGAGPTGVSLAAALSEMDAVREKELKVKILDSATTILPGWDARLIATSERVLAAKGVQIITAEKIKRVRSNFLETESGKEIESDCTIWTAGVKGYDINIMPEVQRTKAGRIVVDRYSRIPGFDNAFAIGDISAFAIVDSEENMMMPSNITPQLAQFAVRQARFVAENIARKEKEDEMSDKFTFSQRGHTILLGNKSIGLLGGLLVTGRMCDYAEDSIVDNFVMEIRNKEKGTSAKALKAIENMESSEEEYPAAFNFVTYATSEAFLDLIR